MSPEEYLRAAIALVIYEHKEALRSLGYGPLDAPWPCPHTDTYRDKRDGATVCRTCHHELPTKDQP